MPRTALCLICAGLALALACSHKSTDSDNNEAPIDDPQPGPYQPQWVGMDVVYGPDSLRKPYSVLLFSADWCYWCRKMKEITFTDSTVGAYLDDYFNCVQIDVSVDTPLAYKDTSISCYELARDTFGVSAIPVTWFLDSASEKLGSVKGYKIPSDFVRYLRYVAGDTLDSASGVSGPKNRLAEWAYNVMFKSCEGGPGSGLADSGAPHSGWDARR